MSKPVQRFQFGPVSAAIFANTVAAKDGQPARTFYSVNIDKVYTGKDGQPHSTNNFDMDDLPKVELASKKAYEAILELNRGRGTFAERAAASSEPSAGVAA
jgi:hypothetical protein